MEAGVQMPPQSARKLGTLHIAQCLLFSRKVPQNQFTKKKKKHHANCIFPGCTFSESHFVEGGKVIKCLGLERPFHLRSHWAGINKDGTNVNNGLTREGDNARENLKARTLSLPRVINLHPAVNREY